MAGRSLILTFVIPAVGLIAFGYGLMSVLGSSPDRPTEEPTFAPPTAPMAFSGATRIGAVGITEPRGESVAVDAHRAGIVEEVFVSLGQRVAAGAPLLRIDARLATELLEARRADLARENRRLEEIQQRLPILDAQIKRLESVLEESVAKARAAEGARRSAAAEAADRRQQADRATRLLTSEVVAPEQADTSRLQAEKAEAALVSAEATEAALLAAIQSIKAEIEQLAAERRLLSQDPSSSQPDGASIAAQRAVVDAAAANLRAAQVELDYLTLTAPFDATILKINARKGESVSPGNGGMPPLILGDTDALHLRVQIDEADAVRFSPNGKAIASPRGNGLLQLPLKFVEIEPLLMPKRSLTSASTDFVDTQVLEVIYRLPDTQQVLLLPGMRMDVMITTGSDQ